MARISTPNFETTEFQIVPYAIAPDVSDDIQQSLSRLVAWDREAQTWRFVRATSKGELFAAVGPEQSEQVDISSFTVTAVAQIVVNTNPDRKQLILFNAGAETIYLGSNSALTTANGFPLEPGSYFDNSSYNGAWFGIISVSNTDLRIMEFS